MQAVQTNVKNGNTAGMKNTTTGITTKKQQSGKATVKMNVRETDYAWTGHKWQYIPKNFIKEYE